ncbi:SMI1 / KNR4 family (SUKH-1) [Ruminococcaceae bacterium KH2T8]|nr:SMI1 / KNR4 family (SUKH-1) [Ruminococcaceae bacterium KH2T8]
MDFAKIINKKDSGYDISDEDLDFIEQKYSFNFPHILRQYYLSYNGAALKGLYANGIANERFGLHDIYPVKYRWDYSLRNKVIPVLAEVGQMEWSYEMSQDLPEVIENDLVPFANDAGGNQYFWQKKTEAVYYICYDDLDPLILAFNSVEAFFESFIKSVET